MSSMPLFDLRDEPAMCSVSELTAQIKEVLEADFADVALIAEVSNVARPRSGHVYLSLKDESSQIRAVIWKGAAQRLAFELEDGLSVRAWGDGSRACEAVAHLANSKQEGHLARALARYDAAVAALEGEENEDFGEALSQRAAE